MNSGHSVISTAAEAPSSASHTRRTRVAPGRSTGGRDRVVGGDLGALLEQQRDDVERGRLAHVVGVRLEGQAQHGDLAVLEVRQRARQVDERQQPLAVVDVDDGLEQVELVAVQRRDEVERARVLGEARAAVADARLEERRADAGVQPDAVGDGVDVGADRSRRGSRSR